MIAAIWRRGRTGTRIALAVGVAVALYSVLTVLAIGLDAGIVVWSIALAGGALTAGLLAGVARLVVPRKVLRRVEVCFVLVWGGLVATCLASVLNDTGPGFLIAPFVEELLKVAGVVIAVRLFGAGSPVRGFALGFLVGAAFEVYENILYIAAPDTPYSGGAADALAAVPVRVFVGFGLHAVTTALAGTAVAYVIVTTGRLVGRASIAAVGAAIAIHLTWDAGPELGVPGLVLMVADYVVIVVVFVITRRRAVALSPSTAGA